MPSPVVLLSLGGVDNIPAAEEELKELNRLLTERNQRDDLKLVIAPLRDQDAVAETLRGWAARIQLFHYAGHARAGGLDLGGQVALTDGLLAYFLEHHNAPRLVFLNGCSTVGHVDAWLAAGAEAVIATEQDVNDERARLFSTLFYEKLVDNFTVRKAYYHARKQTLAEFPKLALPAEPVTRARFRPAAAPDPTPPWGLYLHPQTGRNGANYRLPWYRGEVLTRIVAAKHGKARFRYNYVLLDVINTLAEYDASVPNAVRKAENYENQMFDILVEAYPWPVGSQIVQLYGAREPAERLRYFVGAFLALGQALHYLALSEWWWIHEQGLPEGTPTPPTAFSPEDASNFPRIDYWGRFMELEDYLESLEPSLEKPRPIPEFQRLAGALRNDEELIAALEFFRSFRLDESSDSSTTKASYPERALAALLRATAFLVRYEMVAVRSISVNARKGKPAAFQHYLGKLYANRSGEMSLKDDGQQAQFYYSQSIVLLAKSPEEEEEYSKHKPFLSLSPLIIDLNNYQYLEENLHELIDVFTYSYSKEGKHYYHSANRDVFAVREAKQKSIHTKMSTEEFQNGESSDIPLPAMLGPAEELLTNLFTDLKS